MATATLDNWLKQDLAGTPAVMPPLTAPQYPDARRPTVGELHAAAVSTALGGSRAVCRPSRSETIQAALLRELCGGSVPTRTGQPRTTIARDESEVVR